MDILENTNLSVMPYSQEAEQSVIGAILLEPECLNEVMEILPRADFFYGTNNRMIYSAMLELSMLGKPVDFVMVLERLKESSYFDETTGKVYLTELAKVVPSISNVAIYAGIVRDKHDMRMLMQTAREILNDINEGAGETGSLIDSAEQRIFDIRQGRDLKSLQPIKKILLDTFDRLDLLNSPDADKYKGLPTGIAELDSTITGLNRSDLIILASRPGMGKTSFALNMASHIAQKTKRRLAFFSLEMGSEQLVSRLLAAEAIVDGKKLRTGQLNDDEWTRLVEAGDILSKTEIYIDDTPGITVPEMKAKVRRLGDVDLIVIDYLQLMNSARRIDNRVQEISEITRSLKIMAKELNVPVMALSQLARASEKRSDHRPMLSDLRDSGSIEQDADIVMFLYREGYYQNGDNEAPPDENEDANSAVCIVAKNRHGDLKDVNMHWQPEIMRYTGVEKIRYD